MYVANAKNNKSLRFGDNDYSYLFILYFNDKTTTAGTKNVDKNAAP